MPPSGRTTPLDDIAYLVRSEHRSPTLVALTVRPRSRSELWELTQVSESTIRRTLREFEERKWIRRTGYQYEATELGASVAEAMVDLIERIETEQQVRDVWDTLPGRSDDFSIDLCSGATVTVADSDRPYRPVERFRTLLAETETFRAIHFEVAILEPCKEALCGRVLDGMNADIVAPPRLAEYIRDNCPELISESLESGNLTLRLHDDLPHYGLCLFDDRIAIRGYDTDAGTLRVLLDTDSPDAREWAESIFRRYRRETPTISLETGSNSPTK